MKVRVGNKFNRPRLNNTLEGINIDITKIEKSCYCNVSHRVRSFVQNVWEQVYFTASRLQINGN